MIRAALSSILLLIALPGYAADEVLPREFTTKPEVISTAPEFLTQVIAPEGNCAAISDAASLLVIGCKSKEGKHLQVFHLDENGLPSGGPASIALPKPEALASHTNYPLGLLFHPRLPLLYVWQDVNGPPLEKQGKRKEFADYLEFEHLLVYAIRDGALELVQTGAHGEGFTCGQNGGTIGLDLAAKTLFAPNAMGDTSEEAGIGIFALDEQGLPAETPELKTGKPAGAMKTNVSKDPNKKVMRAVALPKKMQTFTRFPTGSGWFAGREAMLMGGYSGCLVSDFHNGGYRRTWFPLPERSGPCTLAGHPTLPAAYLCLQDESHFHAIAQVDGYLTLLPQVGNFTGAHFAGTPVVLTQQARVAIGDTKSVHLLGLQADGKLDGKDEQLKLPCAMAKGLAYSEKYGRLYVAVDSAK